MFYGCGFIKKGFCIEIVNLYVVIKIIIVVNYI